MSQPGPAANPRPHIDQFLAMTPQGLLSHYRIGVENFDRRVFGLTDEQLDMAWLPEAGVGRWPCRVLLGHLADAEVFFVGRMRQVVAEERPIFGVWDEEAFIDSGLYRAEGQPVGAFIAVIHTLRKWTAEWLATLSPEQFDRKAMHPVRGEQTTRMVLAYDAWHLEHHAWYLNAKVERLAGGK
jgi:hypothetical protein